MGANTTRICGLLLLVGGILGILYGIGFPRIGWGPPGSSVYEAYENCNRLQPIPLLLQVIGISWFVHHYRAKIGKGVRWGLAIFLIGYVLRIAGIAGEFWIFTNETYSSNLRGISYSLTGVGFLIGLIGLAFIGSALWRSRFTPRWISRLLIFAPILLIAAVIFSFVAELEALDPVTVEATIQGIVWIILGIFMLRKYTPVESEH